MFRKITKNLELLRVVKTFAPATYRQISAINWSKASTIRFVEQMKALRNKLKVNNASTAIDFDRFVAEIDLRKAMLNNITLEAKVTN